MIIGAGAHGVDVKKRVAVYWAMAAAAFAGASAAPDENAFARFKGGAYEAAALAAGQAGGAENLALAARALNAEAYLETKDKSARRLAKKAQDYAEAAIEADPSLIEGHLQAAIALAQRGARMAPWRAFFLGLATRARERLDRALAIEPSNAWALSTSAAWHLEVARRGGEGRFGADPEAGHRQFIAARAAAPDNLLIAYECALRLLAYGRDEWRAQALASLETALRLQPMDAFERSVLERTRALQSAVDDGVGAERAFIDAQP